MRPSWRLTGLVATALGLWLARDWLAPRGAVLAARPKQQTSARTAARQVAEIEAAICSTPAELPRRPLLAMSEGSDPFAPPRRAVKAPPAPVPAPAPAVAVVRQTPAPRLPYRYYGTAKEKGNPASVFLALGDKLIQAKAGDTLEGGFRLDSISAKELVFVHLQQNLTLRMSVDGETAWP